MKPLHIALALLVAVIWGVAFVVSKLGLESFTPPQLTALRFMVAAIAALWLPRPRIPWTSLIAIGLTVFTGQFLLQLAVLRSSNFKSEPRNPPGRQIPRLAIGTSQNV